MKIELKWIALWLYWLALLGFVGPWLISAPNDAAVLAGSFLLLASGYTTYRLIRRWTTQKETSHAN